MADRDTQSRYSRRQRNERRDHESPDFRQHEQFSEDERGYGDESRPDSQMGESAYGRSDYRQSDTDYDAGWDRSERQPREERGYARRGPRGMGHYNYGPARVEGPGRSFDSFTGEDQEGRDFTAPKSRRAGGWQGGRAGTPGGYGYPGGTTRPDFYRDDDDRERGFFERAGDQIASWFGDEEAARRREMDHTGRGPKNYTRSDERVLEDACDRLTDDWAVDASNIQVTVENGELTLDGTVATRGEKRRAEDCVEDISGVRHVQNNLRVQERSGWRNDRSEEDITAEQPAAKT